MSAQPQLTWEITTQAYPDGRHPVVLGELTQRTETEIADPLNAPRTVSGKLSIYDEAGAHLIPYKNMIRVWSDQQADPLFHGKILPPRRRSYRSRTVEFSAQDALGDRLPRHFARIGDAALNPAITGFGSLLPADHRGLQLLLDAARNTTAQTARGVPDLNIGDVQHLGPGAFVDAGTTRAIEVSRGDLIDQTMLDIAQIQGAPDIGIVPTTYDPAGDQVYGFLASWDAKRGTDRTADIRLEAGGQLDNLDEINDDVGRLITHAIVLDDTGGIRVIRTAMGPSTVYGVYVDWNHTNLKTSEDILAALAAQTIQGSGEPPIQVNVEIKQTSEIWAMHDVTTGDLVRTDVDEGTFVLTASSRVTACKLKEKNIDEGVRSELDLVPDVTADIDIGSEEI